jgi:hypothetical protein
MADVLQTLDLVTLAQEFRGDVVRQINRKTATLRMLRIVPGEGKNIAWAPEFDGALAENYSEGADATNFGSDDQASATLTWGLYRSAFHVSNLAMDGASTTQTPEGNRQLWARNLVNASAKLASMINADIYAGTGAGNKMVGLATAVDSSGTYATIDRAVDTQWASFETAVAEAVTMSGIRDDLRQIYEKCGEVPDLAGCSPSVFNKVGALFDNTRRQIDSVRGGGGPVKLEFGFQAIECDGTVFFRDKDCTASAIYYLNSDYVEIQYLPSASQAKLIELTGETVVPDDGFGAIPLGMKYEMLAKTGPSEKAEVLWTGGLVVSRPNTCGKRINIA